MTAGHPALPFDLAALQAIAIVDHVAHVSAAEAAKIVGSPEHLYGSRRISAHEMSAALGALGAVLLRADARLLSTEPQSCRDARAGHELHSSRRGSCRCRDGAGHARRLSLQYLPRPGLGLWCEVSGHRR